MTMYPEADYSLYKFARTRHGFWFWFIHLLAIGGHPYTLLVGDWHWSWILVTVVVEFVYWRVIVWSHRNRLRKMNEKGPNNKHRDDVLEEADPVRWKADGAPLMELHIWYAAINDISWDAAKKHIDHVVWLADDQYGDIVHQHEQYLKHPKFDKFLRK